jgi:hypothetical protein
MSIATLTMIRKPEGLIFFLLLWGAIIAAWIS